MTNYNIILNLFSLVLVLSILFIVIYGCQFRKTKKIERFTNVKEDDNVEEKPNKINKLEGFESKILDGLNKGTINDNDMSKLIEAGTFTQENLENIINYVENFKTKNGLSEIL